MGDVYILAIDLAKRSFQVCTTDRGGAVLYNRMISRTKQEEHLLSLGDGSVRNFVCGRA